MKEKFEVGDRVSYDSGSDKCTGTVVANAHGFIHVERDDGEKGSGVDHSYMCRPDLLTKLPKLQRFAPGTRVKIFYDDDPDFVVGEVAFELTADGEQQVVIDEEASQGYTSGNGMWGRAWVLYDEDDEKETQHIEVLPPKEKPAVKGFDEPFEDDDEPPGADELAQLSELVARTRELADAFDELYRAKADLKEAQEAVHLAYEQFTDAEDAVLFSTLERRDA